VRFFDLSMPFEVLEENIEWFNARLAQRGFFLMAFDQSGTSAVPAILQAELVDRSKALGDSHSRRRIGRDA